LKQLINSNDRFNLSPKGDNVAYVEREFPDRGDFELWVHNVARGTRRLLTSGPEKMPSLLWSPDGDAVVFGSLGDGNTKIYCAQADGSRQVHSLVQGPNRLHPFSWHPTERKLLYGEFVPGVKKKAQLWVATFSDTDSKEWDLLRKEHYADFTPREFGDASFSPDGKWIVYSSQEAGKGYLFINQYPEPRAPRKITFEGIDSYSPQWWPDQHELVFLRRETMGSRLHHVYVAKYREIDGGYQFDRPLPWARGLVQRGTFSIDPRGHRLLVGQFASLIDHVVLYENIVGVAERKLISR
jgi:Tol biopolymer transport system component